MTDRTLEHRASQIPKAEKIIEEIKSEFNAWANNRKFAPTIQALKSKLTQIKVGELDFHRKKLSNFNEEQAEIISNRIIQKITTQVANHFKNDNSSTLESVALIQQVFQLNKEES